MLEHLIQSLVRTQYAETSFKYADLSALPKRNMKKRIFISFAIEDRHYQIMLSGQRLHPRSDFEFVDMTAKQAWDEKWKTNCRTRIRGCDGVIALISKNTAGADGALWEIRCAKDEDIPLLAMYCSKDDRPRSLPAELSGVRVIDWTEDQIASFIDSLL